MQFDNKSIFQSEKVIRAFVYKYWKENDIKENESNSGIWLQVPSPHKQKDTRKCLGFNIKTGHVVDWYEGFSGNFLYYVQKFLDLRTIQEAKTYLINIIREEKISDFYIETFMKPEIEVKEEIINLPDGCISLYKNEYTQIDKMILRNAFDYCKKRDLILEDLKLYNIQYVYSGKYGGRLIFPVTENNKIVYFQSRTIRDDLVESDQIMKALNPKFSGKNNIVYGLDVAIKLWQNTNHRIIIITEGPIDAIRCRGVAPLGKSISQIQLEKIFNSNPDEIILALDMDMAGVQGTINLIDHLNKKIPFRIAIYESNDIGSLNRDIIHKRIIEQSLPWGMTAKSLLVRRAIQEMK